MSSNAHVRMGTAYAPSAYGSAQGSRVQQLGGLREDDARLRLSGLREDDAALRLGGLREDDASLRLGTSYNRNAYQSSQSLRVQQLGGLREDDASLRLGNFADQDNAGAFQAKISGLGVRSNPMIVGRKVYSNSNGGSNGTGAASGYNSRRQFSPNNIPRPKASFGKPLSASTLFASGAMSMNGLREDDAKLRLGDVRADDAQLRLGANDFHPRFPVKIEMKGFGASTHNMTSHQISGLFDFLKADPTDVESRARAQAIANTWRPLRDIIFRLPASKQDAVVQGISKLDTSVSDIDMVASTYPSLATFYREKWNRMTRIEAALPTIQKLVADMQAFAGPAGSSPAAADRSVVTSINDRANAISTGMTTQNVVVAVAGGAVGLGIIYAVVKALQKN